MLSNATNQPKSTAGMIWRRADHKTCRTLDGHGVIPSTSKAFDYLRDELRFAFDPLEGLFTIFNVCPFNYRAFGMV